jgi:NAD(P)-dependent dehydrogenase (short-subunit alcohol dehydrogenase family)
VGVLDQFRLYGKRAVVTGASRGLGRSMALALGEAGADVVVMDRTAGTLESTAGEIRARGLRVQRPMIVRRLGAANRTAGYTRAPTGDSIT